MADIEDKVKSLTKDISQLLNNYADLRDINKIKEMEECFQKFFSANTVHFWKYDDKNDALQILGDKESPLMPLDASITKQAINTKSPFIVNHITSDKYYNQSIDNPLEVKAKALLLFPIREGKKVLGVIRLWRGIKQRKVFTKQDEKSLESLSSLLAKIIQLKGIDKKELISLINNKDTPDTPAKKTFKKAETREPKKETDRNISKLETELETLKKSITKYESEITEYKSKITEYTKYAESQEKNKNNNQAKYEELEASALEFSTLISEYQRSDKEQTSKIEILIEENKNLKDELQSEKANPKTKSIKELKAENNRQNDKQILIDSDNMESILHYISSYLIDYEHVYILFEFILYSLNSKQGKSDIEEVLRKSKIASATIDEYYFQGGLKINREKSLISELSKKITEYSLEIFSNKMKINTNIDTSLPASLVFDAPKVQSIMYHLLIDLYELLDTSKPLNINYAYIDNSLKIELDGSIHQQNSLLKSMFNQTKLGGNEKERVGLRLCKKVTKGMNGELEFVHDDTQYKFIFSIPCKKIKM